MFEDDDDHALLVPLFCRFHLIGLFPTPPTTAIRKRWPPTPWRPSSLRHHRPRRQPPPPPPPPPPCCSYHHHRINHRWSIACIASSSCISTNAITTCDCYGELTLCNHAYTCYCHRLYRYIDDDDDADAVDARISDCCTVDSLVFFFFSSTPYVDTQNSQREQQRRHLVQWCRQLYQYWLQHHCPQLVLLQLVLQVCARLLIVVG